MGLCAAKAAWNWLSKWGYIIGMTVAKTAYDVVQGVVTSPYAVFCQCCDWFQDPLNPNKIPILGPLGQAIGEGWAAAYETGSFEDYSKAVGNTAFGVATALGGAAAYRGAMGGGAAQESNLPSTLRQTGPGETFIRYESGHPRYTNVTPEGGLNPGTYTAPSSEGVLPQSQLPLRYNLPDPQIPRGVYYEVKPPAGTWVEGPKPVSGGTGSEVIFPYGAPRGSVGPARSVPQ